MQVPPTPAKVAEYMNIFDGLSANDPVPRSPNVSITSTLLSTMIGSVEPKSKPAEAVAHVFDDPKAVQLAVAVFEPLPGFAAKVHW